MNENGTEPVVAENDNEVTATCPKCQGSFQYTMPQQQLVNFEQFSQVTWVHEEPVECPACHQRYVLVITGMNVGFGLAAYKGNSQKKERPRIIVPPPGAKIV